MANVKISALPSESPVVGTDIVPVVTAALTTKQATMSDIAAFARLAQPTVALSGLSIDWSLSQTFSKTLAAGSNTFTFANAQDGQCIIVELTGASSTVTWPTVKWTGGTPPTQTSSGTDLYTFVKVGSTIKGSVLPNVS